MKKLLLLLPMIASVLMYGMDKRPTFTPFQKELFRQASLFWHIRNDNQAVNRHVVNFPELDFTTSDLYRACNPQGKHKLLVKALLGNDLFFKN